MYENRDKFPEHNPDGSCKIDLESQKYLKIFQGPNHPGITGNMSLELTVCGDEVVESKTRVGYLHRGFEKLMERRRYMNNFPLVCRICVPEPDFNEYCYATAVEDLAGIQITETASWIRMLVLEMSRLQSFLMWMGGAGFSTGMGLIGQWTIYQRDMVLDLFEELTGARVYHLFILPGGVRNVLPDGFKGRMLERLKEIESVCKDIENTLLNNAVYRTRTEGLAVIDPSWVDEYGIVGPNARSAGVLRDVRKDYPYLHYDELDFEATLEQYSDVYHRTKIRLREILLSIDLIRQILDRIPNDKNVMVKLPNVLHWKIPKGETYQRAECTRGEYGYYVVADGSEYPRRVNVRGPSYTHSITLLEKLLVNANIADVAAINVSLHTYPPEIER